jgi:hypothetical protein
MALTYVQVASFPTVFDFPVYNASGTDIPAGSALSLDTGNLMTNAASSVTGIYVVISPAGANPPKALGFAVDTIKTLSTGKCRGPGGIASAICDGAVTANAIVDASEAVAGAVKTHAAGKFSIALALATGADLDQIPVLVLGANTNA